MIVAGPWDLELPTNVIMFERAQLVAAHPHPETEVLRFQYIMKLRQSFQEMCHSREGNGTTAVFMNSCQGFSGTFLAASDLIQKTIIWLRLTRFIPFIQNFI